VSQDIEADPAAFFGSASLPYRIQPNDNDEMLEGRQLFAEMRPWIIASLSQTPVYADIHDAEHEGGDFLFVPRSPP
jgi:hypothetical protein